MPPGRRACGLRVARERAVRRQVGEEARARGHELERLRAANEDLAPLERCHHVARGGQRGGVVQNALLDAARVDARRAFEDLSGWAK